jgi:hypothetical protein
VTQPGRKKEKEYRTDDRVPRRLGHQLPQEEAPAAKMFSIDAIYDQHLIDETRMTREFRHRSDFNGGDVQEAGQQMRDGLGLVFGPQAQTHAIEREIYSQPTLDGGRQTGHSWIRRGNAHDPLLA